MSLESAPPGKTGLTKTALFPLAACLLLAAIVVAVYRPPLRAPFVFDSRNNIAENSSIRMTRVDLPSLKRAAFPEQLNLRPVAFASFALNYRCGKLEPLGFRLVNLSILLLSIPVAYWLALILSRLHLPPAAAKAAALSTVTIWSLHPVLTNGITYVVQRMTSLSTLLSMLALGFFFTGKLEGRRMWYAGAFVFWILALATKESALVVPLVALLFLWHVAPEGSREKKRSAVALLAAVAVSQGALFLFSRHIVRLGWIPEWPHTLVQRALTEGRVVMKYFDLLIFPLPSRLNLDHSFSLSTSLTSPPSTVIAFVFHLVLIGAALGLRRRRPIFCFAVLSFYLLQLAEGTFLPVDIIFEHRLYFPSFFFAVGVVDLFAWGLTALLPKKRETALVICAALAGGCLALFTFQRNIVWSDPVVLWQDVVAKSPSNPRAHVNLGRVLSDQGREEEALATYRRVLKLKPDYHLAFYNQGNVLYRLGRYHQAIASYRQGLSLKPDSARYNNSLGNAYFVLGRYGEALESYSAALRHEPGRPITSFNLGLTFIRLGRRESALSVYRDLTRTSPDLAQKLLSEMR